MIVYNTIRVFVLVSVFFIFFVIAASPDIPQVQHRWDSIGNIETCIEVKRFVANESGQRIQVRLDTVNVVWCGSLWKIQWNSGLSQNSISGYSGERGWKLDTDLGGCRGQLCKFNDELIPPGIGEHGDPYHASFLLYGKPIWLYRAVNQPPQPPVSDPRLSLLDKIVISRRLNQGILPLKERVLLVPAANVDVDKKSAYDFYVYEESVKTMGIKFTAQGDAFESLDCFDSTGATVLRFQVLDWMSDSGLPSKWKCDIYERTGRWLSGYESKIVSISFPQDIDVSIFKPVFPADATVIDLETGINSDVARFEMQKVAENIWSTNSSKMQKPIRARQSSETVPVVITSRTFSKSLEVTAKQSNSPTPQKDARKSILWTFQALVVCSGGIGVMVCLCVIVLWKRKR